MANSVTTVNPYGPLRAADLETFERSLGCTLPPQYRNYLIEFNGGRFRNNIVRISGAEGETSVHHVYGLHQGPAYAQLTIGRPPGISRDYLAICDDALGNHFLIKLTGEERGAIYFLDHDHPDAPPSFIRTAADFREFVDSMSSEDQHMSEFRQRDPDGYREFQKRLHEMKRLRAEEKKKGG